MNTIKTIGIIALLVFIAIAIAGMYKFNYLADEPGYDVDGNRVVMTSVEKGMQQVTGVVSSVQAETDGNSMTFISDEGVEYETIISIPNLGPNSTFDFVDLQEGVQLMIEGEVWELGGVPQLTARSVKTISTAPETINLELKQ